MSAADWARVADVLDDAADFLERTPGLDPDGAVRKAVWGTPDAHVPERETADSELYATVTSAIEAWDADRHGYEPGNGIADLDVEDAITAARAEAGRFRSYC